MEVFWWNIRRTGVAVVAVATPEGKQEQEFNYSRIISCCAKFELNFWYIILGRICGEKSDDNGCGGEKERKTEAEVDGQCKYGLESCEDPWRGGEGKED